MFLYLPKVAFGLELGDVMDHDSPFTKAIGTTLKGVQAQFYTPWKRVRQQNIVIAVDNDLGLRLTTPVIQAYKVITLALIMPCY